MTSTQKGNQYEREAKKILEKQGWIVEGQHRKVMFLGPGKMIMAGRDIFGVDLIAKKFQERTRWIQVSTVAQKSKKEIQVLQFPWNLNYESVQLWLRIPGKKEFRVFELEVGSTGHASFVEKEVQVFKEDQCSLKKN